MYNINEVVVCMDFSATDKVLLRYTSFSCNVLNPRRLYFIHVMGEDRNEYDDTREDLHSKLMNEVQQQPALDKYEVEVIILEGNPVSELLKFTKDKDIDMIIVGAKKYEEGTGLLTQKLAQKAPCSVLFIPEKPEYQLNEILLPVDFSRYSKMAFEEVRYYKEKNPDVKIYALSIFDVPTGYYKTGKSYEEFAEIMKKNTKEDYEDFLKKVNAEDLDIEATFILDDDRSKAQIIYDYAMEKECDLIIVGAKGQSKASAMILGSTTEKLLRINDSIVLMVLRKKGETLGFLDALLKI